MFLQVPFFIILIFHFISIIQSYLILPFYKIIDIFDEDDTKVATNIYDNKIYCNISIGSPNQQIPFLISFDTTTTFIADSSFITSKYDPKNSKTFKKLSDKTAKYVFENLKKGYNVSDYFKIMNNNYNFNEIEIPFILATELSYDFNFSASLGLRYKKNKNVFNFIENLKKKDVINSQVFSYKFDDNGDGELLIGSYPHEYDNNYDSKNLIQSSSLEIGASNNWFLHFDDIFYGENNTEIEDDITTFVLSPEKGMIILNKKIENIIYDNFFEELIEQKKCIEIKLIGYNLNNYVCEDTINITKFKPITFRHKGMEFDFILEAKDLFYHYYDRYFFLLGFSDSSLAYLGKPFFKKYNLIFNQDSKQISLYVSTSNNNKKLTNLKSALPIFLIVLLIILILLIARKLYIYRVRKLKVNEIIEDFDYNYQPEKKTKIFEMSSSHHT